MKEIQKNTDNRYVNDLRRMAYTQTRVFGINGLLMPLGISAIFLVLVGFFVGNRDRKSVV